MANIFRSFSEGKEFNCLKKKKFCAKCVFRKAVTKTKNSYSSTILKINLNRFY